MTKWTNEKLAKEAKRDYKECSDCGHYPSWVNDDLRHYTKSDWKHWAEEYDMSVEEFKKYVDYFFECDANIL